MVPSRLKTLGASVVTVSGSMRWARHLYPLVDLVGDGVLHLGVRHVEQMELVAHLGDVAVDAADVAEIVSGLVSSLVNASSV